MIRATLSITDTLGWSSTLRRTLGHIIRWTCTLRGALGHVIRWASIVWWTCTLRRTSLVRWPGIIRRALRCIIGCTGIVGWASAIRWALGVVVIRCASIIGRTRTIRWANQVCILHDLSPAIAFLPQGKQIAYRNACLCANAIGQHDLAKTGSITEPIHDFFS